VKLVHLVGFITEKFVTMHGHMYVKICSKFVWCLGQAVKRYSIRLTR